MQLIDLYNPPEIHIFRYLPTTNAHEMQIIAFFQDLVASIAERMSPAPFTRRWDTSHPHAGVCLHEIFVAFLHNSAIGGGWVSFSLKNGRDERVVFAVTANY